jgi:signal transduction histidine kinase
MKNSTRVLSSSQSTNHLLLAYVADLELEIDRLRKHGRFIQHEAGECLKRIHQVCNAHKQAEPQQSPLAEIAEMVQQLAGVLHDLQDLPGYHPAHDQVIAIAVRPLAEQVFRWQQRLEQGPKTALLLDLESDYVEWFPARLRHILDNLVSNALKFRDPDKTESWVRLQLRVSPNGYEFVVSDNGIGLSAHDRSELFGLLHRAAPARAAGLGVGLAVVKLLVEQSGGTLTVDSGEGQGTTIVVVLPRYEVHDFLT